MARDYSKGKIYCIKVNTEEEYLPYVGSTTKQYLSQRMDFHRQDFNKWKKNPEKYRFVSSFTLFERFEIENCYIELIELFPCSSCDELRKKEREYIEKIECVNIVKKPIRTIEEKIKYDKICKSNYEEKSKEKNSIRRKIKYDCLCGSTIRKSDKSIHERSQKHQLFIQES